MTFVNEDGSVTANAASREMERIDALMQSLHYAMAGRLRGQAFILEDAVHGHRNRIDVRTMQRVEMTREQHVMVNTYERSARLMREAAEMLWPEEGQAAQIEGKEE